MDAITYKENWILELDLDSKPLCVFCELMLLYKVSSTYYFGIFAPMAILGVFQRDLFDFMKNSSNHSFSHFDLQRNIHDGLGQHY